MWSVRLCGIKRCNGSHLHILGSHKVERGKRWPIIRMSAINNSLKNLVLINKCPAQHFRQQSSRMLYQPTVLIYHISSEATWLKTKCESASLCKLVNFHSNLFDESLPIYLILALSKATLYQPKHNPLLMWTINVTITLKGDKCHKKPQS